MTNAEKITRLKEIEANTIEWNIWNPELGKAINRAIASLEEGEAK